MCIRGREVLYACESVALIVAPDRQPRHCQVIDDIPARQHIARGKTVVHASGIVILLGARRKPGRVEVESTLLRISLWRELEQRHGLRAESTSRNHVSDDPDTKRVPQQNRRIVTRIAEAPEIAFALRGRRREAWRTAMQQSAGEHHAENDGKAHDRQQIYDHCVKMFNQASQEVVALGPLPDDDGSTIAVSHGSVAVPNQAVW